MEANNLNHSGNLSETMETKGTDIIFFSSAERKELSAHDPMSSKNILQE